MKLSRARTVATSVIVAILAAGGPAGAGGTRDWELAGYDELSRGTLDQTMVSNRGEVSLGRLARRLDLRDVALVWCAVRDRDGRVYLGTGNDGRIYRVDRDKVDLVAETGALVVTALLIDKEGDLLAAALPEPAVWRVRRPAAVEPGKPVKAEKWATLPDDSKHVFALALGADGRTVFAGTGPEGKIFALEPGGKVQLYADTEEEHVLCLAVDRKGRLIAGTSPGALLLAVSGPGRLSSLADFAATEVKAIAFLNDDIVAAVNTFKIPPAVPSKPPVVAPGVSPPPAQPAATQRTGDGALWVLHADSRLEKIWERSKGHVLALASDRAGTVYAGLGVEGKVVAVDKERVERTVLDLDEREVLAILAGDSIDFTGTGDAGAAYHVAPGRAAEAIYLSPPLEAGAVSRWGALRWFGQGRLRVSSRSGNSAKPDATWSDWSGPIAQGAAPESPPARYLQLRFALDGDPSGSLTSALLSYRPINQRAALVEVNPGTPFPAGRKPTGTEKEEELTSKRTIPAMPSAKPKPSLDITWKVDNPDEDTLRYRLSYRAVGEKVWRPITRDDEIVTKTSYTWSTESVPEGRYEIRVVADDSPSNPPADVLSDEQISVPVLVDNHPPRVLGLSYARGRLSGRVEDGFSAVAAIEFSVDGLPWRPAASRDGILDAAREEFDFELPEAPGKGPHAIAVRAYDRAGNMGAAEIHVDIP